MTTAGQLRERVLFQAPARDQNGDASGSWTDLFRMHARIQHLKGSETVIASRLQGLQPVIITVRSTPRTRALTNQARAINLSTGAIYHDVAGVTPDERNAYVDVLATWKVGQVDG